MIEISFFSQEGSYKPECIVSAIPPKVKAKDRIIGWGEPWRPKIIVGTGTMHGGKAYRIRLDFADEDELRRFLRGGIAWGTTNLSELCHV